MPIFLRNVQMPMSLLSKKKTEQKEISQQMLASQELGRRLHLGLLLQSPGPCCPTQPLSPSGTQQPLWPKPSPTRTGRRPTKPSGRQPATAPSSSRWPSSHHPPDPTPRRRHRGPSSSAFASQRTGAARLTPLPPRAARSPPPEGRHPAVLLP